MTTISDFDVWTPDGLVPIISLAASPEFDEWQDLVPVCDTGTALGAPPLPRRRAAEII